MKGESRLDIACFGYRFVELPQELRELIIGKLDLLGYHCFSAVCSSWRSIALETRQKRKTEKLQFSFSSTKPQLPYLMFPSDCDKESQQLCFSLYRWKFFRLKLPEFKGGRCVGSSLGWLIMTSQSGENYLLNPASRVQIQLPHLKTRYNPIDPLNHEHKDEANWLYSQFFIRKAILISAPKKTTAAAFTSSTTTATAAVASSTTSAASTATIAIKIDKAMDCIVVAIYKGNSLALCRLGDQVWTTIGYDPPKPSDFEDIIFYNGKFYAVCSDFDLAILELGPNPRATKCNIPPPQDYYQPLLCRKRYSYLVESQGELFMILRYVKIKLLGSIDMCRIHWTLGFEVFKLDLRIPCWVKVKSLGNQMLFLGTTRGISLSTADHPKLEGNCIFYTDDNFFHPPDPRYGSEPCGDMGVFNLDSKRVMPLFPNYSHSNLSPPFWFTPNPW